MVSTSHSPYTEGLDRQSRLVAKKSIADFHPMMKDASYLIGCMMKEHYMDVEAVDPRTGKKISMTCEAKTEDEIRDLLTFDLSEEALKRRLDKLSLSADAKSVLFTIVKTTIKVGSMIVRIGRKVLDVIFNILTEFPKATMGAIFGAVLGQLVIAIPIAGLVFGPFIAPLAIAIGFAMGGMQDFSNQALERRIAASVASFNGLKPHA